jgi:phosphocarrier protein HPr
MVQNDVTITDATGLHARPAAALVQAAKGFSSRIALRIDGREADAKSIMGIMSLGIKSACSATLLADGLDENEAVSKIKSLIETNFAEG